MKSALIRLFISMVLLSGFLPPSLSAQEEPFVRYPEEIETFVRTLHHGKPGKLAFDHTAATDINVWRRTARTKLVELLGLNQMQEDLEGFQPIIKMGPSRDVGDHLRTAGTIETEPGLPIPFWLLEPKAKPPSPNGYPLAICSHGHDTIGRDTYAGVWHDDKHQRLGISRGGPIAVQAVQHGFVTLVPATRGLAVDASLPDLKGRHGKRPCRAQLIHALLAGRTAVGERVWDVQRLLDWALKRPNVDSTRVMMTGNSGGGVLTVHAAAVDTRITVAVPSCSFTSFTSETGYIFHCDCCLIPRAGSELGDFSDIGGLISPRPLLAINGVKDGLHHAADVEKAVANVNRIYKTADAEGKFNHQWGQSGHQFYPDLMWPFIEKWSQ
jgi:hypothetical protein